MKRRGKRKFLKSLLKGKRAVKKKAHRRFKPQPKSAKQVVFLSSDADGSAVATKKFPVAYTHKNLNSNLVASSQEQVTETVSGQSTVEALPFSYNETKLVLIVRDPFWAFSYWDFSHEMWHKIQSLYQEYREVLRPILRVYEVTDLDWNGFNAHSSFDVDATLDAKNWYLELGKPDREWVVDLGLLDSTGRFFVIARSNRVRTPRDGASDVIDEEWTIEDYDEIYALSGGLGMGSSVPGSMGRRRKRLLRRSIFSPGISSFRPR